MSLSRTKLTAQGQISVPAEIRRRLAVDPGSVLEWDDDGENIVVRRVERYSSEEVHQVLFAKPPKARDRDELKQAIHHHAREKRGSR
jgi:AbrB family looped-hinge helix DNA binding protein